MRLSQLDLNLLVVLETVLAERSVARAARLRVALNDPLVVRSGRGIVPTPRSAAMAPALGRALDELGRAIQLEAADPSLTTRQFTLAIADAGQLVQAPHLVSDFAKQMPKARLRVVGIDTLLSSGGLSGTEVDLAIAAFEANTPGVHVKALYKEYAALVARLEHPLVGTSISKRQLGGLRHVDVQLAPGRGYRGLASAYAQRGIDRDVALVVPNFTAAAAIVAATDFVATLPESFVARFGEAFGVTKLAGTAPRLSVDIKLAWHERTAHDTLMRVFRDVVELAMRNSRAAAR
jgi:DNA-binding transcriptional LysR family regulator